VKKTFTVACLTALACLLLFGGAAANSKYRRAHHASMVRLAALGRMRAARIPVRVRSHGRTRTVQRVLPFISDGTIAAEAAGLDERKEGADATPDIPNSSFNGIGGSHQTLGCALRQSHGNTRVNQDCSFRRQAEEDITYNPADPNNLTGGQNDSRVGYNQCGIDFSTNNGSQWGDMLPPFRQHENAPDFDGPSAANPNNNSILNNQGTYHTYDAASDPANAMDSQGRSYFSCVIFDVFSNATGLFTTQSPQGAEGSFYFNVPSSIEAVPTKRFLVVEDNSPGGEVFHDKNMISADRSPRTSSHPTGDNVYTTWTVFKASPQCGPQPNPNQDERFCSSPIFGSMSTDHGLTWSTPEVISGSAPAVCSFGNFFDPTASPSDCNFDQGSYSVVLPNGDVEVIFNNGNTAAGNPNAQQLGVHCHPTGSSSAGTAHMNCAQPVKVGDDVLVGEPQCDFGRGPEECIPGAYIRTNDYPRITKDNTQNNHLYAVWQDYRNGEFDIQMSMSTNGGLTWHEVGKVNPDSGLDHYFAATDQSPKGNDRNGVSYYRTQRVSGENTTPPGGFAPCPGAVATNTGASSACQAGVGNLMSDYVLAGGTGAATPYDFKVISPVFPPPDGIQSGFNGDYSGLTINKGTTAHPIWSDTRNVDPYTPANGVLRDEDVFTDNVGLPNGHGHGGQGHIH
jgi:hypothetical protein